MYMNAQTELSKVFGAVTGGIGTVIQVGQSISGKDLDMAKKARNNLNQKIGAIKQNKDSAAKVRAKLDMGGVE